MPSTSKIVLSIVAFYLVYGIYIYSQTGHFLTLYFLNYFLIVGVAIYSFIIHFKKPQSTLLAIYAIAVISISSSHSLTLSYANRFLNFSEKSTITVPDWYKLVAILIFYSLLYAIFLVTKKHCKPNRLFWLSAIFLLGSLMSVLLNQNIWQVTLLSGFFISFIILSNKLNVRNIESYSILAYQFILFLVIENIRFLTTGIQ